MDANEYRKLNVWDGWARAGDDALAAAQSCSTDGRWRSAVSRSYYAAYSFTASVLTKQERIAFRDDRVGPDHGPLVDLVRDHLLKVLGPSAISDLRTQLRALYAARLTADYMPHKRVAQKEAIEAQKRATMVRSLMERYLK